MARQHSPIQQIKEAKQIARDHGLFVVEKGGKFLLYRCSTPRNVFIAQRGTPESLRQLVCKVANFH